jgi:hypothetical protein
MFQVILFQTTGFADPDTECITTFIVCVCFVLHGFLRLDLSHSREEIDWVVGEQSATKMLGCKSEGARRDWRKFIMRGFIIRTIHQIQLTQ